MLVLGFRTVYYALPRHCVNQVDKPPHTNDGNHPVSGMAYMLPQLGETYVKGKEHDYTCCDTQEEKYIVECTF